MAFKDFTQHSTGNTDAQPLVFNASHQAITVPDTSFIADAELSRDGQDLILTLDNGQTMIVEGYFAADTPPLLISEDGAALTPQLVNSFVHNPTFAALDGTSDISPIGMVKELSGEATVTRTDGTVETIHLGMEIYEGDVIETSAEGAVNIIFIDETEFAVSEDARLAIDEYVFDPSTSEGSTNFSVLRGVFVFTSGMIGRDDPDDVKIDTPVGSIGIRGTIIAGKIDTEGGDNQITVVEGAIVVKNGLGELTLSTQFETVKLTGFTAQMTHVGVLDAAQMNQSFGAVSGVSGSLFSAINDTILDHSTPDQGGAETGQEPSEAVSEGTGNDPADKGIGDDTSHAEAAGEVTAEASPDGNATEPQETVAETGTGDGETISGLEPPLSETSELTGTLDGTLSPESPTGTTVLGGGELLTKIVTAVIQPTTEPIKTILTSDPHILPPSLISSTDGGTTGTGTGTGTIVAPIILDLGTISSGRGFTINSVTDGGIGMSIAALGDVDGDGKADFAFTGTNGQLNFYKTSSGLSDYALTFLGGDVTSDVTVAAGRDVDGDGDMDIIVGTPNADNYTTYAGTITLFDSTNLSTHPSLIADTRGTQVTTSGSSVGETVVFAGDLDGDGYQDYAFTSPYGTAEGALLIQYSGSGELGADYDAVNFDLIKGDAAGDYFGKDLAAAGDLNNDGYDDLIIGSTAGEAYILWGGSSISDGLAVSSQPQTTTLTGTSDFGQDVFGGSDFNRDGYDDLIISQGSEGLLYKGTASAPTLDATFMTSRSGWEISGAAMLGDFNGDGIDDFVFTTSDHNGGNDILVMYGRVGGFGGATIDLNFNDLTTFDSTKGFAMVWDDVGTSDLTLASIGDINGDGLDDLAIGASGAEFNATGNDDGAITVVYGHASALVVEDGDPRDGNAATNSIDATQNNLSILGSSANDIVNGGTYGGLSISAGAGDDIITLQAAGVTHKTINGGSGHDKLVLTGDNGVLDFGAVGEMTIAGIEEISLSGDYQQLRLTTADLFDLLQASDSNELRITFSGTTADTSDFIISDPTFAGTGNLSNITSDFVQIGNTNNAGHTYDTWQFNGGGYTVYIDQALNLQGAVV